jgi:hypothetical protein
LAVLQFADVGAAYSVVPVDVRVGDRPAFFGGEGAGVLDLPRDALRLVVRAALIGRFSGVDGSVHSALSSSD